MKTNNNIQNLFKNKALLTQALTHRSWVNENPDKQEKNERLEFLGDAILEFVVSDELYKKFPHQEEGYLTTLRSQLVNTNSLANVAQKLSVGSTLYLSKGEEDTGGRQNTSILADTTEAIIGALYIDEGIESASKFIHDHILTNIPDLLKEPLKDPKSLLQEKVQSEGLQTPKYIVTDESGPAHDKNFEVKVVVGNATYGHGKGSSKAEAQMNAAQAALVKAEK